jgi:hypothetical protein
LFGSALTAPLSRSRRGESKKIMTALGRNVFKSAEILFKGVFLPLVKKGTKNDAILSELVNQYDRFENDPIHWKRVLGGLELSNPAEYGSSEEMFAASNWLDDVYGLGGIKLGSQASMDMYLNELRVMMFDAFAKNINDPVQLQTYAEQVNTATGRIKFKGSSAAGFVFFAPRLYVSQMATTFGYDAYKAFYDADKKGALSNDIKKQFFDDLANRWIGYATLTSGLILMGFNLNFELDDPKNMFRFTKNKADGTTTTIDFPGGLPFYYRTMFSIYKLFSDGVDHPNAPTVDEIIYRDMKKKFSPVLSAGLSLASNKDFLGRPVGLDFRERITVALAMGFTPIPIQESVISGLRAGLKAMGNKNVVSDYAGIASDNIQEDIMDNVGKYVLNSIGVNRFERSPSSEFQYRKYLFENEINPKLDYSKLLKDDRVKKLFRTTTKKFGTEVDDYSNMKELYRRQVLDETARRLKKRHYKNGKYKFSKEEFKETLQDVSERHMRIWEKKARGL